MSTAIPLTPKDASNVLSAWTALEVLSPRSFRNPEELIDGNAKCVFLFEEDGAFPWDYEIEDKNEKKKIFYHVVIGTLNLHKCINALVEKYGELEFETPRLTGEAVIGVVVVDEDGYPVQDQPAVGISSFAWGLAIALNSDLKTLSEWPVREKELVFEFSELINSNPYDNSNLSLDEEVLSRIYDFLIDALNIPLDLVNNRKFTLRDDQPIRKNTEERQSPWPLVINSFFLKDLATAKNLILNNNAPESLKRYLGIQLPAERHSVLDNATLLEEIVAPHNIPMARWPGKGRHPLVLKQQAAVNLSLSTLKEEGILGINGPPGTGKTTLLRDIVAGIVTERARAMMKFDNPKEAFTNTHYEVPIGNSQKDIRFSVYKIDESLKGFEILIASSNNKAVENISAELPSLNAIAEDADELRYFKPLSDLLLREESWGIISAVLGNASNCKQFSKKFWLHDDVGIFHYFQKILKQKSYNPMKKSQIIQECDPPRSYREAILRWDKARDRFKNALRKVQDKLDDLQGKRDEIYQLQSFEKTLEDGQTLTSLIAEHQAFQPNFWARFFRLPSTRDWRQEAKRLSLWRTLNDKTGSYFKNLGSHVVDVNLFLKEHQQYNQISPWCNSDVQLLRDNVFVEAIKLHKAFIDAAAHPLKHNLGVWGNYLGISKGGLDEKLSDLMSDIWSSFFLVVPSVSTTFASTNKMFSALPNESIGWLLIDEAGQAVPQAAVGALMKSKRAIVTGDPLQIEPVVGLPLKLTKSIFQQFKVDDDKFNPPQASVQTLADEASCYFAKIDLNNATFEENTFNSNGRCIGFPLLVHRRCTSPMFEISNIIAYDNLMVQAKKPQDSPIRNCLGYSFWFDIQSKSRIQDKFCPEEGDMVLDLLWKLRTANVVPNLFIITPFKIVSTYLREMIKESGVLKDWINDPASWLKNNVGTVHTAQGREAEAVFLVLGAPLAQQSGAREWAGSTPNLLNVAVTRAQEVLYVIGNKDLWQDVGVFATLKAELDSVAFDNIMQGLKI